MKLTFDDKYFMQLALNQAKIAFEKNEIPIGAIITNNNQIVAKAYNQTELLKDFTAHAEMLVFSAASNNLDSKYLDRCTLYTTLEPCVMCAGASYWTRISRIVFGAKDTRRAYSIYSNKILHPKTQIVGGVLEAECSSLINLFFDLKRSKY